MGWKNWPYWLKGGLIGFLIGVIVSLGYFTLGNIFGSSTLVILYFLSFPLGHIAMSLSGLIGINDPSYINTFVFVIKFILPINLFVAGSLIGLFYEEIKSKKTDNQ